MGITPQYWLLWKEGKGEIYRTKSRGDMALKALGGIVGYLENQRGIVYR